MTQARNEQNDTEKSYQALTFRYEPLKDFLHKVGNIDPILIHDKLIFNEAWSTFFNLEALQPKAKKSGVRLKVASIANQQLAVLNMWGHLQLLDVSDPDKIAVIRDVKVPGLSDYGANDLKHMYGEPDFHMYAFPDQRHLVVLTLNGKDVCRRIFYIDTQSGESFSQCFEYKENGWWWFDLSWNISVLNDTQIAAINNRKMVKVIEIDWDKKTTRTQTIKPTDNSSLYQVAENQSLIRMMTSFHRLYLSARPLTHEQKDYANTPCNLGVPAVQLNSGELIFVRYYKNQKSRYDFDDYVAGYSILQTSGEIVNKDFTTNTQIRIAPGIGVFFLQDPDVIEFIGDVAPLRSLLEKMKIAKKTLRELFNPGIADVILDFIPAPRMNLEELEKIKIPERKVEEKIAKTAPLRALEKKAIPIVSAPAAKMPARLSLFSRAKNWWQKDVKSNATPRRLI